MSTHNMFLLRNKKNIATFWLKKAAYQELGNYIVDSFLLVITISWLKMQIMKKLQGKGNTTTW